MRALILLAVLVFATFGGVNQVLYAVDETQSVVITRFGEITEVELHLRRYGMGICVEMVDSFSIERRGTPNETVNSVPHT